MLLRDLEMTLPVKLSTNQIFKLKVMSKQEPKFETVGTIKRCHVSDHSLEKLIYQINTFQVEN